MADEGLRHAAAVTDGPPGMHEDEPAQDKAFLGSDSFDEPPRKVSTKNKLYNNSCFSRVAENDYFVNFTLAVIAFNACWIAIDTNWNHKSIYEENGTKAGEDPAMFWFIVESCFVVYFTTEVTIRFFAFKSKCRFYRDAWFVFDGILVTFMILEWVIAIIELVVGPAGVQLPAMSVFRLLRLARLTRMARLMRSFPELVALIKGMKAAFRGAWVVGIFLVLVMFIFSIIFIQQMTAERPAEWLVCFPDAPRPAGFVMPEGLECDEASVSGDGDGQYSAYTKFGTFGDAMMTFLTHMVLGDNLNQALMFSYNAGPVYHHLCILCMTISMVCLLNMLIGVMCEVITDAADAEKNETQEAKFAEDLQEAFAELDKSQDGCIQKNEWDQIKGNDKMKKAFGELGIEEDLFPQLELTLFPDDEIGAGGLEIEEFSKRILALRPETKAGALDMEYLSMSVKQSEADLKEKVRQVEVQLLGFLQQDTKATKAPMQRDDEQETVLAMTRHRKEAKDGWLKEVSSELLFAALQKRTSLAPFG